MTSGNPRFFKCRDESVKSNRMRKWYCWINVLNCPFAYMNAYMNGQFFLRKKRTYIRFLVDVESKIWYTIYMKDGLMNSRICAYDVKFAKYRKKLLNHDIRMNTMLLSRKTFVKLNENESNIIGHLCYAASKLWNVCNYERIHYKELGLGKYPD